MSDRTQLGEAQRARFLAARYPDLLGLRIVPWGVVLILLPLTIGSLVTGPAWWIVLGLFLASIPAAWAFTWLSVRYYRHRFGQVRRRPPSGIEVLFWLGAFGVLGVVFLALQRTVAEDLMSLSGLFGAGILGLTAWRMGPFARHRLVFAGVLALVCALPLGLLTASGRHPFAQGDGYLVSVYGLFMIVIGLVDHWLLVREFRAIPAAGHGQPR